jgi:hypothetical protein
MISSSDMAAAARDDVATFEWEGWLTYIALNSVIAKAARIAGFHILDIGASFVAGRWKLRTSDTENFRELRINPAQLE